MSTPAGPKITVLYFAAASTTIGRTSEEIPIPNGGLKLAVLGQLLVSHYPNTDLKKILETSQWSVDCEMVEDPDTLKRTNSSVAEELKSVQPFDPSVLSLRPLGPDDFFGRIQRSCVAYTAAPPRKLDPTSSTGTLAFGG
ncbi:unnamed protein product [Cyclocybe aegerita]|uniref:Uncharacterized protein n=1 Tax=Cyclocybe aegerita TaxID=1973307 RepID=A0A8S0WW06_CYCAE|nr:unnamed protein product [Cyclocybe aegerita]